MNISVYGANIFTSIGRQVTDASLSRYRLREFKRHNQIFDNHNGLESFPELRKNFTIMKLIDHIPAYLREMLCVLKVVLSYVVQYDPTPPVTLPPLQPNII